MTMLDALLEPSLHPETDEASASPILNSLSRPRQAALCLAASRCGRRPLGAGEPPALRARRGRQRRRAAGVAGKKWLCISYPFRGATSLIRAWLIMELQVLGLRVL